MDYEVDPLFEALKKAIVSDASVMDRMSQVMDECARQREAYGRDGGLGNDAEYPLVLAYGSM